MYQEKNEAHFESLDLLDSGSKTSRKKEEKNLLNQNQDGLFLMLGLESSQ